MWGILSPSGERAPGCGSLLPTILVHKSIPLTVLSISSLLGCAYAQEPVAGSTAAEQEPAAETGPASVYPQAPEGAPPVYKVEGAVAKKPEEMKPYRDLIPGTKVGFDLLPIPAGKFLLGSPESEDDRKSDEGPQVQVQIEPFWMGKFEVTWDEYQIFQFKLDQQQRDKGSVKPGPNDPWADAVSRPTPPYVPMDFNMGIHGYPAICMTQFAAKQYCKWLSQKTGRFYRLPTEAEWEYACRAGTTTAYSFGDELDNIEDYAWFFDNADDQYQKVGQKKPNPWGLHDMHGNVSEWVLDRYSKEGYGDFATLAGDGGKPLIGPMRTPKGLYPRVVRGGSWDDDPDRLRSAARIYSRKDWKVQDPQLPKSIWYHTDANFVGFRIVRPLKQPTLAEMAAYWDADIDDVLAIQEKQRRGGR
jgi:formylglycine-generating enzyme required for sulfatase activity